MTRQAAPLGARREQVACLLPLALAGASSCSQPVDFNQTLQVTDVSGGWFDQRGLSPATTTINGCTWGGSAIKTDLLAGPGLFLEFGNTVVTSRIRIVHVIRAEPSKWIN